MAQPTQQSEKIYTSEKLTELRKQLESQWAEMAKHKPASKEAMDAMLDVYKTQKLIDGEIATIKKQEQDAIVAEQRNARVKMADDLIEAAKLSATSKGDAKKAADDKLAELRESVVNELLVKFAPRSATTAQSDKTPGEKGATAARILEKFHANRAAGMSDTDNKKAIVESGESRGTTGAVILAWQRENGEK